MGEKEGGNEGGRGEIGHFFIFISETEVILLRSATRFEAMNYQLIITIILFLLSLHGVKKTYKKK